MRPGKFCGESAVMRITRKAFESFVADGVAAIPEKFRALIKNVAFLVADEPTLTQRRQNNLRANETLLGLYEGIPRTARGEDYGALALPDRITIFTRPIEEAAQDEIARLSPPRRAESDEFFSGRVRQIVRDTVWHEVAHHFGLDEAAVKRREKEREK